MCSVKLNAFSRPMLLGAISALGVGALLVGGLPQTAAADEDQAQVNGITGGGARGITSGGARGISGAAARGITGGGARGITGGGARGITGGGARGITGGGARGITGGGARGITGGGARGITGGGARGLAEGVAHHISNSGVTVATGRTPSPVTGMAGWVTSSFDSVAMGPVESVRLTEGLATVVVLGQSFHTDRADIAQSVSTGDYVIVAAAQDGELLLMSGLDTAYVPGASRVGLVGHVRSRDTSRGAMTVGDLVVDYTALLAVDPAYSPSPGEIVEATGVQPLPGGTLIVGSYGADEPSEEVSPLRR